MELVTNVQQLVNDFLQQNLKQALTQLETTCLELTETSSFSQQSEFLAVIHDVNARRDTMHTLLQKECHALTQSYPDNVRKIETADEWLELSLLADEHLESDLTVSSWVKKTATKFDDIIWTAMGRLIVTASGDCEDYNRPDVVLPLSPMAFGEALQQATSQYDLAFRFELVLFKAFGKAFEENAEDFYDQLNRLLDAQGIAVPVRPSAYRKPAPSTAPTEALAHVDDADQTLMGGDVPLAPQSTGQAPSASHENWAWAEQAGLNASQQGEQQSFQQVLDHMFQQQAAATSEQASMPTEDAIRADVIAELGGEASWSGSPVMKQVMDSLVNEKVHNRQQQASRENFVGNAPVTASGVSYGNIQRVAVATEQTFVANDYRSALTTTQEQAIEPVKNVVRNENLVEENEAQFFEALQQMAASGERCEITTGDADLVDLIGMLFKRVLDDAQVPDKAKTLLSYMHTPYLKLALIDEQFFVDAQHPARMLLNTLAEAATKWQQDWRIFPRVQEAVHTVLSEYKTDIVVFEKVLSSFEQFETSLDKRAGIAEKRSQQQVQSEELRHIAKTEAWIDITGLLKGQRVPKIFYAFYEELWLEVMCLQYVGCAGESAEYKKLSAMAARLIGTVQEKYSKDSMSAEKTQRFEQVKNHLMRDIAQVMKVSGISLLEAQQYFKKMREVQQLAFEGYPVQWMDVEEVAAPVVKDVPKRTDEEDKMHEYLSSIAFGGLFEFIEAGIPQKLKLAWHNPKSQRFMFVNHSGVKSRVISMDDLVAAMLDGSAKEVKIEKRSFFERALESIKDTFSLKQSQEEAAYAA